MSDLKDPRVLFAAERTGLLIRAIEQTSSRDALHSSTFFLGMCFIILGAICAVVSSYQYAAILKTLTQAEFPEGYGPRWGLVVNIIVALLGLALVVALYAQ